MTNILIDSPITGKRENLTQAQFNSYMAQTNGAVLQWIVEPVAKHAEHDQSSHGNWAGNNQNPSGNPFDLFGLSDNYQTFHRPAQGKDGGASLDDLTNGIYPDDVYSPRGVQIFGTGYKDLDKKAHALIMEYKGKPDKEIRIYRAVPKKVDAKINTGDWVTPIKEYAEGHGESNLNNDYQILYRDVKAKEIFTSGDSWLEWGYVPEAIAKHAMHDQSTHGSWAGNKTGGGNNLSLREVIKLHGDEDSLKSKVYEAESALLGEKTNIFEPPIAPSLKNYPLDKMNEYDKAYKEYKKEYTDRAVEDNKNILSKDGEQILDGSPSGVRKYVEKIVRKDWFVEKFGDGSSLPPLRVKTDETNDSGRHILKMFTRQGVITRSEHTISINRQNTKDEMTILHEISHLATVQSQTKPFEGHGKEFANNYVYVVSKAVSPKFGKKLKDSFIAKGIRLGD